MGQERCWRERRIRKSRQRGSKERNKTAPHGWRDRSPAQPGSHPRETPVPAGLHPPRGRAHWQTPGAQPDEMSGKRTEKLDTRPTQEAGPQAGRLPQGQLGPSTGTESEDQGPWDQTQQGEDAVFPWWHLWWPLTPGSIPSSPPHPGLSHPGKTGQHPLAAWEAASKKELEGVASGSLQALRCQDFLSQWMGTQETQAPRLVLFGVSRRQEKRAVTTGSGPSCGLAPGSGHSRKGLAGNPRHKHCPESPARPRSCLSLSLYHYVPMTCVPPHCHPVECKALRGRGCTGTDPSLYPQCQAQGQYREERAQKRKE